MVIAIQRALGDRIQVIQGDITTMAIDAIVNAANAAMLGGGGVDGAIHRAAGPELLGECRRIGGCPPGEARLTHGYRLPARYVIHTVGPLWRGGDEGEPDTLAACYLSSLAIAREQGFREVAFPAVATGVYGFPRGDAARIAVAVVSSELAANELPERVYFVCFDAATAEAYRRSLSTPG